MIQTTIKQKVKFIWDNMPDQFYSSQIVSRIKKTYPEDSQKFADTFMRRARQLRQDGVINYKVLNVKEGLYQKLKA